MRTLTQYLDLARARQGIESDRQLGTAIGLKKGIAHQYRKGAALPSDDAMVALAHLAGIDPEIALLDLNQWRAKGAARSVYMEMARRLAGTTVALLVALGLAAGSGGDAIAGTNAAQINPLRRAVYIMGIFGPRWRRRVQAAILTIRQTLARRTYACIA